MTDVRNFRIPLKIPILTLICFFSFLVQTEGPNVRAATINVPADQPTIQSGINAASDGDTVLVSPATYVENINFYGKNIVVGSLIRGQGDTSYIRQTVIDGNRNGSVVTFERGEDSTAVLKGFTITNGSGTWIGDQFFGGGIFLDNDSCPSLMNLIVTGNTAQSANGAGICCIGNSNCRIKNVIVTGNNGSGSALTNDGSGGIYLANSSPTLTNVMIANNTGLLAGGMFCNLNSNPVLINVTIAGNTALPSRNNSETAELMTWGSNPVLTNTIIWNDLLPEIVVRDNAITISYSDVQGGLNGIMTYDNATINWLDGNINSDPLFVDPVNEDYRLQADSPCIDAGNNSAISQSVVSDLDGNPRIINDIVDMGAYENTFVLTLSVLYVDPDATGANDGSSWTDAYTNLQEALIDAEVAEKPVEIRTAQGIYKPNEGLAAIPEFDWRTTTFQLINGVTLRGGYAGFGEPDPDTRDINLYRTILSGDLNGDDGPDFTNNTENCYHVVTGSGTDASAVLDGFTITGGNSNTLKPYHAGGGIYSQTGSPTLIHCTFSINWAGRGGGMANEGGNHPTLMNCKFVGNSANFHGGGMYNLLSSPILINCVFVGNSAPSGGGMYNWNNCSPILTNCTFSGNTANAGGGMCSNRSSPSLVNTILWNDGPDEIYLTMSTITVAYCNIQSDQGLWPGEGNMNSDPLFVDADGPDDIIGSEDDNLRLSPESPCIDAGDNSAVPSSVVFDLDGKPRIVNEIVDMGAYEGRKAQPTTAHNPSPTDGASQTDTWITPSWSPGSHATSHDVYFGDNFDDVNDGTGGSFMGNQVETTISIGSAQSPFLEPGTTYYWRIDEVNDLHPHSPWKGDAWSFSVELAMPEAGLVAYYPLSGGRSTTITDASGNGHHGMAQAVPEWVDSPIGDGTALYFDGSNPTKARVNCGTWNPSARTGQLTVALWVRWDGPVPDVWQDIIAKRDRWNEQGTEEMWLLGIGRDSHAFYFYRTGLYPPCGNRAASIGRWTHVAVTFDGALMVFYIDGDHTGSGRFSFGPKRDSTLNIGCAGSSGWGGFHGALDEIRLYNKALSPANIKILAGH